MYLFIWYYYFIFFFFFSLIRNTKHHIQYGMRHGCVRLTVWNYAVFTVFGISCSVCVRLKPHIAFLYIFIEYWYNWMKSCLLFAVCTLLGFQFSHLMHCVFANVMNFHMFIAWKLRQCTMIMVVVCAAIGSPMIKSITIKY